ncbi:MAG: NIPSNAP family protein [Pirellulales bacterium]
MQRRDFLAGSTLATFSLLASRTASAQQSESLQNRYFFDLRVYHFPSEEKQQAYEAFLAETGVAALNRAGVQPVGVFNLRADDNPRLEAGEVGNELYVLLPHKSSESFLQLPLHLAADAEYQQAGEAILRAPKNDPAFSRYDSTLLLAMKGFPAVKVPTQAESRLFELRTYESHNEERAKNKLEMFTAGEFPIFEKAGMPGVFFGGAICGENLPHLTYMVVHESADDVRRNWQAFGQVPEWRELLSEPSYRDNVSKVVTRFIRPTAASQI